MTKNQEIQSSIKWQKRNRTARSRYEEKISIFKTMIDQVMILNFYNFQV